MHFCLILLKVNTGAPGEVMNPFLTKSNPSHSGVKKFNRILNRFNAAFQLPDKERGKTIPHLHIEFAKNVNKSACSEKKKNTRMKKSNGRTDL